MISRRNAILAAPAFVGVSSILASCYPASDKESYDAVAARTWRLGALQGFEGEALSTELVRYATLAPSSHNTQCWKFRLSEHSIEILPDLSRRCPVVDPDDHHLFVSLGCATENLVQAALAHGLRGEATFDNTTDAVRVRLEPTPASSSPLFQAIAERQCTRAEYDGKSLSSQELAVLQQAGNGNGVRVLLLTERDAMEKALEYIVQGNTAQLNDPVFVEELKAWIRFSSGDAVRLGDGLSGATSGNPSLPAWLGRPLFGLIVSANSENDKCTKQVRSSAGIAVFVSDTDDKAHWVEAGRCYERFALQAAALGIRNAFLNQPVEVSALRPQFASFLGVGNRRPDLVIRFGRGPKMPPSLRRPVETVIV